MKNIEKTKNLIWFLIFLGLSTLFVYIASNIMYKINRPLTYDLSDLDLTLLKVFFSSIVLLDAGFLMAAIWNLFKWIVLITKRFKKDAE